MSLTCPDCGEASLSIDASITLPPDSRSDDIVLQLIACRQCAFRGVAVYEESRRGRLDAESWDHVGYRVPADERARLASLIAGCPASGAWRCPCAAHQALGRQDAAGRWEPPAGLDWRRAFRL